MCSPGTPSGESKADATPANHGAATTKHPMHHSKSSQVRKAARARASTSQDGGHERAQQEKGASQHKAERASPRRRRPRNPIITISQLESLKARLSYVPDTPNGEVTSRDPAALLALLSPAMGNAADHKHAGRGAGGAAAAGQPESNAASDSDPDELRQALRHIRRLERQNAQLTQYSKVILLRWLLHCLVLYVYYTGHKSP